MTNNVFVRIFLPKAFPPPPPPSHVAESVFLMHRTVRILPDLALNINGLLATSKINVFWFDELSLLINLPKDETADSEHKASIVADKVLDIEWLDRVEAACDCHDDAKHDTDILGERCQWCNVRKRGVFLVS